MTGYIARLQEEKPTEKPSAPPDPCERQPCKHGRCRRTDPEGPEAGPPGYRCHCHEGFTGNHCDIRGEEGELFAVSKLSYTFLYISSTDSPQRDREGTGGRGGKGSRRGRKRRRKCRKQKFRDYFIEADGCR